MKSLLMIVALFATAAAATEHSVGPREMPDYACLENAIVAISVAGEDGKSLFAALRDFYLGRLTVMDESRDWLGEASFFSSDKTNDRVSMASLKACAERYQRYSMRVEAPKP